MSLSDEKMGQLISDRAIILIPKTILNHLPDHVKVIIKWKVERLIDSSDEFPDRIDLHGQLSGFNLYVVARII